jgi:hypothetical protein
MAKSSFAGEKLGIPPRIDSRVAGERLMETIAFLVSSDHRRGAPPRMRVRLELTVHAPFRFAKANPLKSSHRLIRRTLPESSLRIVKGNLERPRQASSRRNRQAP